jgi:hypothetical protein
MEQRRKKKSGIPLSRSELVVGADEDFDNEETMRKTR